ncbi:MAG: hypothetical protein MJY93_09290 [Fibrobacter sp.]|nr:hypothetical protein [Fibrobacter sp.]
MAKVQLSVDCIAPMVRKRIAELVRFANYLGALINKSPAGTLRISQSHGSVQYYHVKTIAPGDYIPRENLDLAKALAQKTYDEKVLKQVLKQVNLLKNFERRYGELDLSQFFETASVERKSLIDPHVVSNEYFADCWNTADFGGLAFNEEDSELLTSKNVRVRSKSEVIIAEVLERLEIPFRYEFPLQLKNGVCIHPDFVCLNVRTRKEIVWEHFGLMDDLDYVGNVLLKLRTYSKNGFVLGDNLVFTMENKRFPLSIHDVEKLVKAHLL